MARYAGGGKTTVESCRCVDVLDWHRPAVSPRTLLANKRHAGHNAGTSALLPLTDMAAGPINVRFTPKSGHSSALVRRQRSGSRWHSVNQSER